MLDVHHKQQPWTQSWDFGRLGLAAAAGIGAMAGLNLIYSSEPLTLPGLFAAGMIASVSGIAIKKGKEGFDHLQQVRETLVENARIDYLSRQVVDRFQTAPEPDAILGGV